MTEDLLNPMWQVFLSDSAEWSVRHIFLILHFTGAGIRLISNPMRSRTRVYQTSIVKICLLEHQPFFVKGRKFVFEKKINRHRLEELSLKVEELVWLSKKF